VLALSGGRAVGRALVLAVGDVGRVEDLYVSPDARRRGVGRALLARAVEVCARSAFRHVLLGVHPDNAAALALYASFGFRKVGSVTAYWRQPTPAPAAT
jgi:ribosomal-protein-alanine N-acetyltransferase